MTDLKTLKDMDRTCMLRGDKCCVPDYNVELRQEAIKWVKADNEGELTQTFREIFYEFFNLTEEDLE